MRKYNKPTANIETDESEDSESHNSDNSNNSDTKQLWCICRSSDGSRFMICCDKCEEWYHGDCINITPKEAEHILKYYCAQCEKREPTLKSVYKSGAGMRQTTAQSGQITKGQSETIFLKTGASDKTKLESEKKNHKSIEKKFKSEVTNRPNSIEKPQNPISKEVRIKTESVLSIRPDNKFIETLEMKSHKPVKSEKAQSTKPDNKFIEMLENKTKTTEKVLTAKDRQQATKDSTKLKIQTKINTHENPEETNVKLKKDPRKCMDCVNCLRKLDCGTCINCKTKIISRGCLKRICVKLKKKPEITVKQEKLTLTKLPGEFIPKKAVPPKKPIREIAVKREAMCPSPLVNPIKRVHSSSISSKSSNSCSVNPDKKPQIYNQLPKKTTNEKKLKRDITPIKSPGSISNLTTENYPIDMKPMENISENQQNPLKRPFSTSYSSEDSNFSFKKSKISDKILPSKILKNEDIKAESEVKNGKKRKREFIAKSESSKSQSSMETCGISESNCESNETFVNNRKPKVSKPTEKLAVKRGRKPRKLPLQSEQINRQKEFTLEPCRNIGCEYLRDFGSKYCSNECGIQFAQRILEKILPERIKEWDRTESYADRKDLQRKTEINKECLRIQEKLILHDRENAKLARLTQYRRSISNASDYQNDEGRRTTNNSAEVRCVTCGDFAAVGKAMSHMQICFQKIENRTMIFADYKEQLMGSKLFCDFYDPSVEGYCKRLDALCDHNKDDCAIKVDPEIICGYPLTENNESNKICLTAKVECVTHVNWERIQRAVIDMKRYRLLVQMEELRNEEMIIERNLFHRRNVMNLLLHRTIDHQPNRPML